MESPESLMLEPRPHELAATMFTDIEGYTALMQRDELVAMELRERHRKVFNEATKAHSGQILQYYGDGTLSKFSSTIDAVRCAVQMQLQFRQDPIVPVRIGIHSGDIIATDEEIIGDSVNIASRIESVAMPGSILVSGTVYDEVKNQPDIETVKVGSFHFKNVANDLDVHAVSNKGLIVPERRDIELKLGYETVGEQSNKLWSSLWMWGAVAAVVLVAMFALLSPDNFWAGEQAEVHASASQPSIAVMPFRSIGEDTEGKYFIDGVREEILNHLTQINDLEVRGRSVVDKMERSGVPVEEMVSKLGLTHYLDGSARKDGDNIRISVQFVDAATNTQLWARSYDRTYHDIWHTQSEIARKVADLLSVQIDPGTRERIEKIPTANPRAWDEFLKAAYYLREYVGLLNNDNYGPELQETGIKMVEASRKAIKLDPEFALGYSFLAYLYREVAPDSALILNDMAIALDPDLSTPYYIRAEHNGYVLQDTIRAIADFRRAISNRPDLALPYWHYAMYEDHRGKYLNSLELSFQAINRDPDPWILAQILSQVGWIYLEAGAYDKSAYYLDKALVLNPDNLTFLGRKAHLYRVSGQLEELHDLALEIMELSPDNRGLYEMAMYHTMKYEFETASEYFDTYFSIEGMPGHFNDSHTYAFVLQMTGRDEDAIEMYSRMKAIMKASPHESADYEYARMHAAAESRDSAYYHLKKAIAGDVPWGMADFMIQDPMLQSLRSDTDFTEIHRKATKKTNIKFNKIKNLEKSGIIPENIEGVLLY